MNSNHDRILDQFTRQALPFASAPTIRNREALDRIVRMAEAGPADLALDVACGPGLLVCAFAGTELALDAYRHAVKSRYRFYSYGDCMLIL